MERSLTEIRFYTPADYSQVKRLYEEAGWFDPVTDAEDGLATKIRRDPESILVATRRNRIVGSVRIIEDGSIAQLFRLISPFEEVRILLLQKAEKLVEERGYEEVNIVALHSDARRRREYLAQGYAQGRTYDWYWKVLAR